MGRYDFSELDGEKEDKGKEKDKDKKDTKYDFTEVDKDNEVKEKYKKVQGQFFPEASVPKEYDPRKNFRISKVCGNCKYFHYTGVKSRRGYCKLTNIHPDKVNTYHNTDIKKEAEKYGWPPTHTTCTCDEHELRSRVTSIEKVGDFVERDFDFKGNQIHRDLDD